ncbi:hypothetical protein CHS0354_022541 [Potamilus streckersoni]|uniref:Uncharacterized protein n=1 Tax=Potamilus streckersoni TaxID=2493646 RepID=A0AAE0WAF7_9BIVA|nr:hypothetical protein CHS0354_022541 [Potamilus streckersoni]
MAHSVTYQSIVNNNIRNLYSGVQTKVQRRTQTIYPFKRLHDEQKQSSDRFNGNLYEYSIKYKVRLPKAPAFRILSQEEVHEIVHRLSKPNFRRSQHQLESSQPETGTVSQKLKGLPISNNLGSSKLPSSEKSYSKSNLEAITNRVSKATVASDIRAKMRKNVDTPLPELNICWKVQKPVHLRYKLRNSRIPKLPPIIFIDKTQNSMDS